MAIYCLVGDGWRGAVKLPGVDLEDDWGDGSANVSVEGEWETDNLVQWCEENDIKAELV